MTTIDCRRIMPFAKISECIQEELLKDVFGSTVYDCSDWIFDQLVNRGTIIKGQNHREMVSANSTMVGPPNLAKISQTVERVKTKIKSRVANPGENWREFSADPINLSSLPAVFDNFQKPAINALLDDGIFSLFPLFRKLFHSEPGKEYERNLQKLENRTCEVFDLISVVGNSVNYSEIASTTLSDKTTTSSGISTATTIGIVLGTLATVAVVVRCGFWLKYECRDVSSLGAGQVDEQQREACLRSHQPV